MVAVVTSSNLGSDFDSGSIEVQKINVRRATTVVYGLVRTSDFLSATGPVSLQAGSTVTAPILSDNSSAVVSSAWVKAQGYLTAAGGAFAATSLAVSGSSVLGTTSSDVLDVNATTNFDAPVTLNGSAILQGGVILGSSSAQTLTVNSTSTFASPVTFNSSVTATTFSGNLSGNAGTSTKLATARTLSLTGDVTWSSSFDGSANVTAVATLSNTGVAGGVYTKLTVDTKGRVTSATLLSASDIPSLDWSKITTGRPVTLAGYGITDAINVSALGAVNGVASLDGTGKVPTAQLPSATDELLEYDNFAALPVTGAAKTLYVTKNTNYLYRWDGSAYVLMSSAPGSTDAVAEGSVNLYFTPARAQAAVTTVTGNAGTATKLSTARSISVTGDAAWTVSFDGSANASATLTLANSGVTAGTYTKLTVDAKGRVTGGAALNATDVPNLDWSKITTGRPTTTAGYGITDSVLTSSVNAANGVAGLDATGKIPTSLLPSYVDTVVEVANYAALPGTGATNTIYVTLDNNNTYRWSGTVYVLVSGSGSTTDAITEGSVNLYFTAARAQSAVTSVTGNAGTATQLATPRAISASGDATWSVTFDGTTAVSSALTLSATGVSAGTYKSVTVDTKGRVTSASNPTTLSGYGITDAVALSIVGAANGVAGLDATGKVPTAQLPALSGDLLEYANLAAFPVTGTTAKPYVAQDTNFLYRWNGSNYVQLSPTGVATSAATLSNARTISASGDATWSVTFNGSANVSSTLTLANSGVTAGVYNTATTITPITVDAKGRITLADVPVTITPAFASVTDKPTTLAGYGITDGQPLDGDLTAIAGLAGTAGFLKKTGTNAWTLDTSTYLTGNQSVTLTGDATGTGTTAITVTLANSGVTAGVYNNSSTAITPITVDAKGRVTATGASVTITPAFASVTGKPTTLAGYGITDAAPLASPVFTGTPTAPTAAAGVPSLQVANTTFVLGEISGVTAGNVASATRLANSRTISASGDATWSVSFDGTSNASAVLTLADSGVVAGTYNNATSLKPFTVDSKGRITSVGTTVTITPAFASVTGKPTTLAGYGITDGTANAAFTNRVNSVKSDESAGVKNITNPTAGLGYSGGLRVRLAYQNDVDTAAGYADVVDLSTGSDASTGGFNALFLNKAAQQIVHKYAAAAGTSWTSKTLAYTDSSITGNAATATRLETSRTISVTTDATGSASFDGTGNAAIALTLANSGVTAGTYRSVTVDAKGRVTAGTAPTTLAGYGITDAAPSSHVGATGSAHGVATASVAGFMSSTDKSKLDGIAAGATANVGTVTGVTATAPVVSSGGTAPVISMAAATSAVHGYMTSTYAAKLDGIAAGAQVNTVTSVAGKTGAVTLASSDVGLGNVNNTSDASKPVSTATQTALDLKANLASPTFTGTVNIAANGLVVGTNQLRVTGGATLIGAPTADASAQLNVGGAANANVLREVKVDLGAGTAIDLTAGALFTKTVSATTNFTVTNVPAAGRLGSFILEITNGGAYTIGWFATIKWPNGVAPSLSASGRDTVFFYTHDGGTTWNGFLLGKGQA